MVLLSIIFNSCVVVIVLLIFYKLVDTPRERNLELVRKHSERRSISFDERSEAIGLRVGNTNEIIIRRPPINTLEYYINPVRGDSDNEFLSDDEKDWSDSDDEE